MTDKIKLKADKFVNDKKLKLNYIKPKDLKILLAEFCEEQISELKAECDLAIEGRDVQIQELQHKVDTLQGFLDHDIEYDMDKKIKELEEKIKSYESVESVIHKHCENCADIKELETRCNELFLQTCEQAELIEKMKCCFNCKHSTTEYEHCITDKHEKWEVKENDIV